MEAFRNKLKGRDTITTTVPAVCYEICNNANLEAQSRGKVPSLCAPDSDFNLYLKGCKECLDQYSDTTKGSVSGSEYTDTTFLQYINYCNTTDASEPTSTQSTVTIAQSWLSLHEIYEPITATNIKASGTTVTENTVLYRKITLTSTLPAYFFHTSVQALISSFIPPVVLSDLAASAASTLTGDPTSLIYAALEEETRPPWFYSAIPSTYTAEMSSLEASINQLRATPISTTSQVVSTAGESVLPSNRSSPQGAASTGSGSKAWIAGAVVGSVVGVVLILLGIILFVRRKKIAARASKEQGEKGENYVAGFKPELHAESVQLPQPVYEMDATNLSELAVHEMPQELDVEQESKTR